jgi:uncharacterized protein YnzC (UPF0291/DUF896 family)
MSSSNNELKPAGPERLAEAMKLLEADPVWRRVEFLYAKSKSEGLTFDEEEEFNRLGQPAFREGDVIQEFARDLEAAKAKEAGNDAK